MNIQVVVTIESLAKGRTKNWLTISALIPYLDNNRVYRIDFCGTEIHHDLALPERILSSLKDKLCEDFGYPPYDMKKCKKVLGEGLIYTFR